MEKRPNTRRSGWATVVTNIAPNRIEISGYPLHEIIYAKGLPEVAHLLVTGMFPGHARIEAVRQIVFDAAKLPAPPVKPVENEDISRTIIRSLLLDEALAACPAEGKEGQGAKSLHCLGRMVRYLSSIFGHQDALEQAAAGDRFSSLIWRALIGRTPEDEKQEKLLEALAVATVDHGVTPPSAQTTILAASVRTPYEAAVAQGIGTITDVHGGAGAGAADFFITAIKRAREMDLDRSEALAQLMAEYVRDGRRIPGMGHRIHQTDPRCDVLLKMAAQAGVAGECVECTKQMTRIFSHLRGITLPINVDGVIGAVIGDMGLDPRLAKAVFIFGRVAGLSAHYFEEVGTFPEMRLINFSEAVYKGPPTRAV